MSDLLIRPLKTLAEFEGCVRLQEATWGAGFSERVPVAVLKVSQRLGGIVAGAYDEAGELAGFVYGMTGVEDGLPVHWSDMLAVRPEHENRGLGTRLKAYQRDELLTRGIETVYWTFDPLEARNAHVNFSKLGIVVREYAPDMYGDTDSPLHQGIGTDRLVALWLIGSDRVARRAGGEPGPEAGGDDGAAAVMRTRVADDVILPTEPDLTIMADRVLIPIPASIQEVKARSSEAATEWREATREALSTYIGLGYEVRELYRRDGYSDYLLVRE